MIFCGHSRKQSQARPVNPGRYSGVDRMPGGGTEQRLKAQRAANIDIDMLRYVLSFFFYDTRRNSHKQNPSPSLSGKTTKATLHLVASSRRLPGTKKLPRQACYQGNPHKQNPSLSHTSRTFRCRSRGKVRRPRCTS